MTAKYTDRENVIDWNGALIEVHRKNPRYLELLASGEPIEPYIPFEHTLEGRKVEAQRRVTEWRDAQIDAGIEYNGHRYQTRPTDRENISGGVLRAMIDPAVIQTWITEDNQIVQLDAAAMIGLGQAVAAHKEQMTHQARVIKDAILAASTIEEVGELLAQLP